jgi:hypothetical protein
MINLLKKLQIPDSTTIFISPPSPSLMIPYITAALHIELFSWNLPAPKTY